VFGGGVVISRAGGPITIPFFGLSEADQQYVKDLLTERGEEALIPERPPIAAASESGPTAIPGGHPPVAAPPAGGGFGPGLATGPAGGYSPGGGSSPAGGYAPDGYDSRSSGGSSHIEEHERRADAAQRGADRAMQESQDRIDRMVEQSRLPTYERVPVCSNCQSRLTDAETQAARCPRCGARWVYDNYNGGSPAGSSTITGGSRSRSGGQLFDDPQTKRTVLGVTVVVVVLGVVVAVAIGVIAVAMAIASASKAGRKYQQ
jgi:hypothetical protein